MFIIIVDSVVVVAFVVAVVVVVVVVVAVAVVLLLSRSDVIRPSSTLFSDMTKNREGPKNLNFCLVLFVRETPSRFPGKRMFDDQTVFRKKRKSQKCWKMLVVLEPVSFICLDHLKRMLPLL